MNTPNLPRRLCYLTAFLLLALSGCSTSKPSGPAGTNSSAYPFRVGMAEIDITPPVGYRMAGYFDERFSTGTHDPLKAKAIVLQQGSTEAALVFCDLLGPSLNVTTNARAAASLKTGIPVANIVMAATHSHTGPQFDDVRSDYFRNLIVSQTGKDPHQTIDYPAY